jgi:glycosyltransferase involved in cell wall biosynthesis
MTKDYEKIHTEENFFSIVVPCYNAEKEIRDCINHIFKSSFQNFEIICVDDCSTDRTAQVINSYNKVEFVRLTKNSGAAVARNEGAKRAKGNIILFIDSDILVKEDTLEKLNKDIIDKKGDVIVCVYSKDHPFEGIASNYKNLHMRYTYLSMPDYMPILNTSCVALRKEVFKNVNGFDSEIKILSAEDWDLGQRIVTKGYRIYLDKRIDVLHKKNFNLKTILKTDLRKSFGNVKMLIRTRKREKKILNKKRVGSLPSYIFISSPVVLSITLLMLLAIVTRYIILVPILFVFVIIYLIIVRNFFRFLSKTKGFSFFLVSIFIYFLNIWSMIIGGIAGLVDYFVFNNKY